VRACVCVCANVSEPAQNVEAANLFGNLGWKVVMPSRSMLMAPVASPCSTRSTAVSTCSK
jgi:hypothetical protein